MNKFSYKNLTPFKWFVLENFPFIEADFDALTEWQLFCKIGKEINKIIDSQNLVGSEMEKFSQAFIELKSYVDNYFKNLDVQDEINNKLNEMAETGELQTIIDNFLKMKSVLHFENVNDMCNSQNLVEGSICQTMGFYNAGDQGGAFYTIINKNNISPDNIFTFSINNTNLIAKLFPLNNTVSINQAGGKGDDNFDNGTILNTLINSDYNIFINEGIYITSADINCTKNKIINGIDKNLSIIKAIANYPAGNEILGFNGLTNLVVKNIGISGNSEVNIRGDEYNGKDGIHLLDIVDSSNVEINNVKLFDNIYAGIRIGGTTNISNIVIKNSQFLNVDCGIISVGTNTQNIDNLDIYNNYINGHDYSEGISIYGTGICTNLKIHDNIIKNKINGHGILAGTEFETDNLNTVEIYNNIIDNCYVGISIYHCQNSNCYNNKISNTGLSGYGIGISLNSQNNNIFENEIENCGVGININAINNIINNNKIYNFNYKKDPNALSYNAIRITADNNIVKNNNLYNLSEATKEANFIYLNSNNNIIKENNFNDKNVANIHFSLRIDYNEKTPENNDIDIYLNDINYPRYYGPSPVSVFDNNSVTNKINTTISKSFRISNYSTPLPKDDNGDNTFMSLYPGFKKFTSVNLSHQSTINNIQQSFPNDEILIYYYVASGASTTIKNGTGNIITFTGNDIVIDGNTLSILKIINLGNKWLVNLEKQINL